MPFSFKKCIMPSISHIWKRSWQLFSSNTKGQKRSAMGLRKNCRKSKKLDNWSRPDDNHQLNPHQQRVLRSAYPTPTNSKTLSVETRQTKIAATRNLSPASENQQFQIPFATDAPSNSNNRSATTKIHSTRAPRTVAKAYASTSGSTSPSSSSNINRALSRGQSPAAPATRAI